MTTEQRIDKQIADLREMESSLSGIGLSIDHLRRERDLLREENARLQGEVMRQRLGSAEAIAALQACEIALGDGRIRPINIDSPEWYQKVWSARDAAIAALAKLEAKP